MIPPPPERGILLPDPESTLRVGAALAAALESPDREEVRAPRSLYLRGSLGAGKTTLVRGLMRGLGHRGPVRSPTYTLLEPYELSGISVYHFDLYRLAEARELDDFGARDYFHEGALCVVEWPERGREALPSPDLSIEMRILDEGRHLLARGRSTHGRELLAAWSTSPSWSDLSSDS